MTRVISIFAPALVAASLLIVGCGGGSTSSQGGGDAGSITIGVPSTPTGYSMTEAAGLSDLVVADLIGEGLTRPKRDGLTPEAALATSWKPNADATVWTFKLRDDVKWHDGQPFTAEDVKFTFDLFTSDKVRAVSAGQVTGLERTQVVDAHTVRMRFSRPQSSLPVMLSYNMPIVPKHALEGQDLNEPQAYLKNPIGTGPFQFDKAVSGQYWQLKANSRWWGGKVSLKQVTLKVTPDANSTIAQLKTGALDISLVQPQQTNVLKSSSNLEVLAVDQPTFYYLATMNNKAPFRDPRVRQALNYAVDKDQIIKTVLSGYGKPAAAPIAPTVEGHASAIAPYPYDPAKAKALLAQAGWKLVNGTMQEDGKPVSVELTTSEGVIGGPQLAEILQQSLRDIGIKSTIKLVEFKQLYVGVFDGEYQSSVEYLAVPPSPDLTNAFSCKGGQNRFFYCNKRVDEVLAEANATLDAGERNKKYAEFQRLVHDDPPGVWLYFPQEVRAISNRVKGFPPTPLRMALTHLYEVSVG